MYLAPVPERSERSFRYPVSCKSAATIPSSKSRGVKELFLPLRLFAGTGPVEPVEPLLVFEDVGLAESGFVTKEGVTNFFPTGSIDGYDEASGARVDASVEQKGLHGCFMHPPYKKGYGNSFQQFVVKLPSAPAGSLEGFTALRDGAEKSDGVTYRVLVNGRVAWVENRKSMEWQPFKIDLSTLTG